MSVASLNNGSLQLSELVISNEKYSNATGYVASSSTFSSGVTGTSLSVGAFKATSIGIQNGNNGVELTCGGSNNLIVSGQVEAPYFTTTVAGTSTFDDVNVSGDITCSGGITTPQVSFPFGIINGITGGACNITSDGLALFNSSNEGTLLSVPSANNLTVGGGVTASGYIGDQATISTLLSVGSVQITSPSVETLEIAGNVECGTCKASTLSLQGSSGSVGNLGVSADGTALFFNGVQIYPAP